MFRCPRSRWVPFSNTIRSKFVPRQQPRAPDELLQLQSKEGEIVLHPGRIAPEVLQFVYDNKHFGTGILVLQKLFGRMKLTTLDYNDVTAWTNGSHIVTNSKIVFQFPPNPNFSGLYEFKTVGLLERIESLIFPKHLKDFQLRLFQIWKILNNKTLSKYNNYTTEQAEILRDLDVPLYTTYEIMKDLFSFNKHQYSRKQFYEIIYLYLTTIVVNSTPFFKSAIKSKMDKLLPLSEKQIFTIYKHSYLLYHYFIIIQLKKEETESQEQYKQRIEAKIEEIIDYSSELDKKPFEPSEYCDLIASLNKIVAENISPNEDTQFLRKELTQYLLSRKYKTKAEFLNDFRRDSTHSTTKIEQSFKDIPEELAYSVENKQKKLFFEEIGKMVDENCIDMHGFISEKTYYLFSTLSLPGHFQFRSYFSTLLSQWPTDLYQETFNKLWNETEFNSPENIHKKYPHIFDNSENTTQNEKLRKRRFPIAYAIDSIETKSVDDAIDISDDVVNPWVYIHIADTANSILPKSFLDKFSLLKGATQYFPENIQRLLPELFDQKISLTEGKENNVLTFSAKINSETGEIMESEIFYSVVENIKRITYQEVDQFFLIPKELEHNPISAENKKTIEYFNKVMNLALIRRKRYPKVSSGDGFLLSNYLVEEFMILAGEIASKFCLDNKIPILFRNQNPIHPTVESLTFINESLDRCSGVSLRFLRKIYSQPANYSPVCTKHSSLMLDSYTHCTSPLRRYPDMIVHHQIRAFLSNSPLHFSFDELTQLSNRLNYRLQSLKSWSSQSSLLRLLGTIQSNHPANEPTQGIIVQVSVMQGTTFVKLLISKYDIEVRVAVLDQLPDKFYLGDVYEVYLDKMVGSQFRASLGKQLPPLQIANEFAITLYERSLFTKEFLDEMDQDGLITMTEVSVTQFNILGGSFGTPDHFPYVKKQYLDWQFRRELIAKNATQYKSDIICLQELDNYWEYFRKQFDNFGYESVFVARPSIQQTSWSKMQKQDGCGIFFNKDLFTLRQLQQVNYHDVHDRVGLVILLEFNKEKNKFLIVATTHLYWNSALVEDQLKELKELEQAVLEMLDSVKEKHGIERNEIPYVITGDFNNTPSSPIYQYMVKEFLHDISPPKSAYSVYNKKQDDDKDEDLGLYEPEFTTVTNKRKHTIDYIWFSRNILSVVELKSLGSEETHRAEAGDQDYIESAGDQAARGIPNSTNGSDHIPICTVLKLTK